MSRVWYTNTFLPNHPKVQPKKAKTEDSKRTKNQNEHVVQEHIHGDAGLNNHLTQMGIMDSETKEIDDPRRVIHGDEMPQFLDYATSAGETYLGETGSPLAVAETQNRETGTIDMYADLSGFLYGIHAILGRKHHVESMADCFEAPDWAPRFNNQIWPNEGRSTYALASTTEKGVQTGATLLARLKLLRKEIDHRNELERATGGKEIKFPIYIMYDNHSSRYDEAVMEALYGPAAELGFEPFFEKSLTSQFLQARLRFIQHAPPPQPSPPPMHV